MMKKIRERRLHFMIFSFLLGIFAGINLTYTLVAQEPAHKYLDYFHRVYQLIKTEYVDEPDTKDVFFGAIDGMVRSLKDPFSRFLDKDAFAELKEETSGNFVGVGIEITIKDGQVTVIAPIADTPAMRAGVLTGDVIFKIDTTLIKNKNLNEIIKLIRGVPGTRVRLFVNRKGVDEPIVFELERQPIKVASVTHAVIAGKRIGYLKIKIFSADTDREVEKALRAFNQKNITRLVVDLRGNPGGYLDKAIRVCDFFLKKGDTIVTTKGRTGAGVIEEFKSLESPLYTGKMILLVDQGSASASEILSGAIMDNKRGSLLGEKTFGKGSVQKIFNLNENTGIALTVAKYYTPSGTSIHGTGIAPQHAVPLIIFSDADKKHLSAIYREKVVEQYVKETKCAYTEEHKKAFAEFLRRKGMPLTDTAARFLLKTEIGKLEKRPAYDLEFDTQLVRSLELLAKD